MKLLSHTYRDIQRYYEGTYVKLPEFGDRLFLIRGVNEYQITFCDSKGEEGVIYLDNENPYDLTYILPHKSNYQLGNICYNMIRIPARQYHRGITAENCAVYRLMDMGWKICNLTWDNMTGFVEKQPFLPLSSALGGKVTSAALSNRISVNLRGRLYVDHKIIGNVKGNVVSIHPLFVPEFNKVLHLSGCARDFIIKETRITE